MPVDPSIFDRIRASAGVEPRREWNDRRTVGQVEHIEDDQEPEFIDGGVFAAGVLQDELRARVLEAVNAPASELRFIPLEPYGPLESSIKGGPVPKAHAACNRLEPGTCVDFGPNATAEDMDAYFRSARDAR